MEILRCPKCRKCKMHNDFHKSSRNSSGRQSQCKSACVPHDDRRTSRIPAGKPRTTRVIG